MCIQRSYMSGFLSRVKLIELVLNTCYANILNSSSCANCCCWSMRDRHSSVYTLCACKSCNYPLLSYYNLYIPMLRRTNYYAVPSSVCFFSDRVPFLIHIFSLWEQETATKKRCLSFYELSAQSFCQTCMKFGTQVTLHFWIN